MDAQLPLQALDMALGQRQILEGLIHHSDRGSQYCSNVYVERLRSRGASIRMSTPGQPTDNAFAESFFKTVKCEEVYVPSIEPSRRRQPRLQKFLEDVYNAKRLHSSFDYVLPDEYELEFSMC